MLRKYRQPGMPMLADVENRGKMDLIAGSKLFRNLQGGRFDAGKPVPGLPNGLVWMAADFDGDGRTDLAYVTADGAATVAQ